MARWDAPSGGGITTQGDNLTELNEMIADAVRGWFSEGERPQSVKLHFVEDPELAVA